MRSQIRPTVRIYNILSQIHECRNWERDQAVSYPGIFVLNFGYNAARRFNHSAISHLLLESVGYTSFTGNGQEVFNILQFSSTYPGNFFTKLKTAHLAECINCINSPLPPTLSGSWLGP
jgi:hypothetical protein